MAIRTISATGGNFNATATWVEGIVPVAADDIIGNSASGNLIVNVASTVRSIQFDNGAYNSGDYWGGLLTLSANFTVNGAGSTGTVSFSPNISMTGSSTLILSGNNPITTTYGFTVSTSLTISAQKQLRDEFNWQTPDGVSGRSFTGAQMPMNITSTWSGATPSLNLWFSANQAQFPATFGGHAANGGSASVIFKPHNGTVNISGLITEATRPSGIWNRDTIIDGGTGTYSFQSINIRQNGSFKYISGRIAPHSGVGPSILSDNTTGGTYRIDFPESILFDSIFIPANATSQPNPTWIYENPQGLINTSRVLLYWNNNQANSWTGTLRWNCGLSASLYSSFGFPNGLAFGSGFYTNSGLTRHQFESGQTYKFDRFHITNLARQGVFLSLTASVPATINVNLGPTHSVFANQNFTDINFVAPSNLLALTDCSFVRTTGITSSISSAGGGGAFTFVN